MRAPGIVRRHPELGWLVALALIVAVAVAVVTTVTGVFRSDAALPATSPDQVVEQVLKPHDGGYSGTITTRMSLTLPGQLTRTLTSTTAGGAGLLRGTHQIRYWYGGSTQQRTALVGAQGREEDLFRNGDSVLLWDTRDKVAQRVAVSSPTPGSLPFSLTSAAALTPPQLAEQMLAFSDDDGDVTLRSGPVVADQPTYELVVRPDSDGSRIGEIDIQVDGRQMVPLGVQVYTRAATDPAVDVSFTAIDYSAPSARNFTFAPPSDAKTPSVQTGALSALLAGATSAGTGWSRHVESSTTTAKAKALTSALSGTLREVSGSWGSGRLLETPLVCLLVTSKGRVLAGPVEPSVLYAAAR